MKNFSTLTLATALLAVGGAAFGQGFTVTITADENGNGNLSNSFGSSVTLSSSLQNDPGPGGLTSVLTYGLLNPPGLTAGDVFLTDDPFGSPTDVVRFNPNENGGSLVFYSDNINGFDSLADTPGPPSSFYTNTVTLQELSAGGVSEVFYTPTTGQPGFVTGAAGPVTYHIISDSVVPEPTTTAAFGLGGLGMFGLMFAARKRTRQNTPA